MEKKIVNKTKKTTKKGFFEVNAPITSTKIELYGNSQESLTGKTIKLDLTKNLRGKSLELKLRVKADGDKLYAEAENISLSGSYIRRVIRNGTDYCEDSFITDCKDYKVQIKTFLITRKRVSREVLKALRFNAKNFLEDYVKTRRSQEIFSDVMTNKVQKQLALKLKKIYPLALCEIREFNIIGSPLVEEEPKN